MDIYRYFADRNIGFRRYDHPAVFTCEEAERMLPPLDGEKSKNLFVRDKKARRHFLIVVGYEKDVDLKALGSHLGTSRLGLASTERLKAVLGVEAGSVSILALINDADRKVEPIIDERIWRSDRVAFHPLVNTSTVVLSHEDLERFLDQTGHASHVMDVPGRPSKLAKGSRGEQERP